MNTIKIRHPHTKMIAHRGLSKLEKENSAAAFVAAGNRSYFGTECDIHITKDRVFVVCHDETLKRVSSSDLFIKESTIETLNQVCLYEVRSEQPKNYLRIPSLEDYLQISIKYEKHCVIELKPEFTIEDIQQLFTLVKSYDYLDNVTFISFRYANLVLLRNQDSQLKLQYLVGQITDETLDKCLQINASIDVNYQKLTEEQVHLFHSHNLEVNVWTVDDPKIARKLIRWGVDYLTTNILE